MHSQPLRLSCPVTAGKSIYGPSSNPSVRIPAHFPKEVGREMEVTGEALPIWAPAEPTAASLPSTLLPLPGPFTPLSRVCVLVGSGHFLTDLFQPQHSSRISCPLENGETEEPRWSPWFPGSAAQGNPTVG